VPFQPDSPGVNRWIRNTASFHHSGQQVGTAPGRLAPLDRATLAYVAVASAFTLWRWPAGLPMAGLLPVGLALVALTAAVLAPRARRSGALGQLLGEFYALVLTGALYTHVGLLNAARGVAHDAIVQGWEVALFGSQPSLEWIRAEAWPAWSTVMHGAYLSYYLILTVAPGAPWLTGRRAAARRTLFLMMTTFYVCYGAFLVFPVAGPRYRFPLPQNEATAVPLAIFTHRLLAAGSAWGTAFPSSHVAVAVVAAGSAWSASKRLGAVLLPGAALLALATVYGQFHYAVDALAGAGLGGLVLLLSTRIRVRQATGGVGL
jgi:membrane-associated phospholipid phosphatase